MTGPARRALVLAACGAAAALIVGFAGRRGHPAPAVPPRPATTARAAAMPDVVRRLASTPGATMIDDVVVTPPAPCAGATVEVAIHAHAEAGPGALRYRVHGHGEGSPVVTRFRAPGRYELLAEVSAPSGELDQRTARVTVLPCAPPAEAWIAVTPLGGGRARLTAELRPPVAPPVFRWDLGDGAHLESAGPEVEHTYPVDPGGHARTYAVALEVVAPGQDPVRGRAAVTVAAERAPPGDLLAAPVGGLRSHGATLVATLRIDNPDDDPVELDTVELTAVPCPVGITVAGAPGARAAATAVSVRQPASRALSASLVRPGPGELELRIDEPLVAGGACAVVVEAVGRATGGAGRAFATVVPLEGPGPLPARVPGGALGPPRTAEPP